MTARANLILVGPMGAGKTSVGKIVAEKLKLDFLDSDRELEARCGADIPWRFDIEGESGFRAREKEVITDLCSRLGILLATGGGAILSSTNRKVLGKSGIVIYLSATADQIYNRVRHDNGRPLLQVANPRKTIAEIIEKRDPYYREIADIILCSSKAESAQSMSTAVLAKIKEDFPKQFTI